MFFLRHAQSTALQEGIVQGSGPSVPLSEAGHEQAKAAAEQLKNSTFDHIYASAAVRTVDTAEYVRKYHADTPYTELDELIERSKGNAEGMLIKDFEQQHPEILEAWSKDIDIRPPGGENFQDVEDRVMKVINAHLEKHAGEKLLYVIHGNVIRALLGHFLNAPTELRYRIQQRYCAYNEVSYDHEKKRWSIDCVNCTGPQS